VLIFSFLDYRGVVLIYEHPLSLRSYKSHGYPCGFIDYTCERPQWEIGVDKYFLSLTPFQLTMRYVSSEPTLSWITNFGYFDTDANDEFPVLLLRRKRD